MMGAALNPTSDTGDDKGGPSMAASLTITSRPVTRYTYTWAQAIMSVGAGLAGAWPTPPTSRRPR